MTRQKPHRRSMALAIGAVLAAACAAGCGPELDVGSDVLWSARFEDGSFDEWTLASGRGAQAFPSDPNNKFEIATGFDVAHTGMYAARLTIDASAAAVQDNALLSRADDLPSEAYYSAWYKLPRSVMVEAFWVIFKFRQRTVATDPSTEAELFDLDLVNLTGDDMSVVVYDHRIGHNLSLDVAPAPVVKAGEWFHVEAFYRNAPDATGRLTYWLDGNVIKDLNGEPMAPSSWIEWDACNVGESLSPSPAVIYIDDCAISRTRVGPQGSIAR